MADEGHDRTDKILEKLEKQIQKEYRQAARDVDKKAKEYFKQFKAKEADERKRLEAGEITQDQFDRWRVTQMLTGQRWEQMRDTLAADMVNANNIARSTMFDHMGDVYALNRNYAAYEIEADAKIDTSWTLYNNRSTEFLFTNKDSLLPPPKKGGKAWQAMQNKDTRWNQQKINSSLIQGILQGDSISEISDRLFSVVGMNANSAIRSARTMTTYVENRGRDDTYEELREQGIELDTVWVATLDDRTRSTHRWLHGEVRDEETGMYSNGLRFPADPRGDPEEVYNCRCCETSTVKGFPIDMPKWSPKMGDMTFEEWLGEKEEARDVGGSPSYVFGDMRTAFTPAKTREEAEAYADQFVSSYKSKYSGNHSYKGMDVEYANKANRVLTEVFGRYDIPVLGDIMPMNKRESRWKNSTADAAYQWGGNGGRLFINASYFKNTKALDAHIKEADLLLQTVLGNVDALIDSGKYTGSKLFYLEGLRDSGCQCIAQLTDDFATATFAHECGHMLDDKLFQKAMKEAGFDIGESMEQFARGLSGYACTSRYEYVAESFAAHWFGFDDRIDPRLAQLFTETQK